MIKQKQSHPFYLRSENGTTHTIAKTVTTIGSNGDIKISEELPDLLMRHCTLLAFNGGVFKLCNLSKIKPTKVNNEEMAGPVYLKIGDTIEICGRKYTLMSEDNIAEIKRRREVEIEAKKPKKAEEDTLEFKRVSPPPKVTKKLLGVNVSRQKVVTQSPPKDEQSSFEEDSIDFSSPLPIKNTPSCGDNGVEISDLVIHNPFMTHSLVETNKQTPTKDDNFTITFNLENSICLQRANISNVDKTTQKVLDDREEDFSESCGDAISVDWTDQPLSQDKTAQMDLEMKQNPLEDEEENVSFDEEPFTGFN
ncbi:hypothetical protein EIN_283710 [Entamoeba invadens IP1]|uniref:FHA domain-containing protein n=2 Tax=Entamoeba invadens TaxID=33085 RepID=L7FJT3_ENTIV|nr:hypothetical protein EIN_283710 [Entamoeba invadens IP1]ELP84825.1 hypothetical protein EIN_283710 [Entamoeba invadens IP1]BAN42564.1 hypothetical protein [Entamoeba invadens]|eukprot:XP_004184171.1 hypothetical protein EIN_283710 [Entamoeba invadens IP1]